MCQSTIYSIGHGHKSIEVFIGELKSYDIQFLIDVRTTPFSKWSPMYNRDVIASWLTQAGIIYGYMGDVIGGKPKDDSCYDEEGYFDYKKMAQTPSFQSGLKRLVDANSQGLKVAIMCTETDPSQCHRSKLIGRELYFLFDISVHHITDIKKFESQESIMKKLTGDRWQPTGQFSFDDEFIDTPPFFKSRKAYRDFNDEINDIYD